MSGYYILYCKDVNLIKYVFIILIFLYKRKLNYNFHENNKHFFKEQDIGSNQVFFQCNKHM